MGEAQAKARDAERKLEVDAIRKALAFYYIEHGQYPESSDWLLVEKDDENNGFFSQALEEYLPEMPRDPLYGDFKNPPDEDPFSYQYKTGETGGENYVIYVEMESDTFAQYTVSSPTGDGGIAYGEGEKWTLTEENCNALTGWHWYNTNGREACWSKTLADYVSWNKGVGDDADNPGAYTCAATPTAVTDRMTAASAGEWYKIVANVAGTDITVSHNGSAGYSVISALAISDCLDGTRDLCTGDGCLGADTTAVNLSLRTWASAIDDKSALPYCADSACDSAVNSDWRNACEQNSGNDLPLACSNGLFYKNRKVCSDGDSNYIQAAAVLDSTCARPLGHSSCSCVHSHGLTSGSAYFLGFRVVVRP